MIRLFFYSLYVSSNCLSYQLHYIYLHIIIYIVTMSIKENYVLRIVMHIALMAVVAALILFCLFRWMRSYTNHGEMIQVPNVVGVMYEEATTAMKNHMLEAELSEYRYVHGYAEGAIVEQRPKAGSYVKESRTVYLTVNSGKIPTKPVPDVADNSSLRAAESRILGAGFKLTPHEYVDGDADWVYNLKYQGVILEPGTELPEGSTLTIVVGNGNPIMNIDKADSVAYVEPIFFSE